MARDEMKNSVKIAYNVSNFGRVLIQGQTQYDLPSGFLLIRIIRI
jgi:hypothetical protein